LQSLPSSTFLTHRLKYRLYRHISLIVLASVFAL
jgi:hypothetical protein